MKRKMWKRIMSTLLVFVLLFGLTACGKDGDGGKGGKGGKDSKDYANAQLAKEGVFSEQTFDLPVEGNDMGIRALKMIGDTLYTILEVYDYESAEPSNSMKIMTMNKDGSDVQINDFQLYMGGVKPDTPESTGEEGDTSEGSGTGQVQPRTAVEATTEEATEETEEDSTEGTTEDAVIEIPAIEDGGIYEYTGIGNVAITSENKIYGIKNYYYEDYRDPENYVYQNNTYICCWDLGGIMLWESPIEGLQTDESWSYVQSMVILGDGSCALILGGDKYELVAVDNDGNLGARKELPEEASNLANGTVLASEGGKVKYTYWDANGEYKMWLGEFDFNTMTQVTAPTQLPDSLFMSGYNSLVDGGAMADMIYTTSLGVYGFNMGDTEPTLLMSFVNSDLATNNMTQVVPLDEASMVAYYYDDYEGKTKGGIFTKVNPEDIEDKAVLTLAANYVGYEIKKRIVEYNKTNPDYRIVIKDYSSFSTSDDYMASYTKLNNDILAEGMPDILVADTNMPINSYISKGWLADIDQLIAEDEELSQVEFMDNVFEAYRVDGKLHYVIPSFNIRTVLGKTSIVGDRTTWTMKDFTDLMASMPEGTQAFGEMTRGNFMYQMMQYCGSDFVDASTGKCAFNTENFIALLEYAKTLPEELSEDYFGEEYWLTYESQYREDRTVLMACYVSQARDMNRYINGSFGEEVSYIGFPTDSGNGSVVLANQQYVLSAKSKNLDGAWEFIRYYLTEEYQNTLSWEMAVDKKVFAAKAQEAMEKPYYLDEKGDKVEYDDTFWINNEEIILPPMTREQVDEFVAMVEGIDKSTFYQEDIQNIINEEVEAFFSGQKSAADVAGNIQNRAQLYVNENR